MFTLRETAQRRTRQRQPWTREWISILSDHELDVYWGLLQQLRRFGHKLCEQALARERLLLLEKRLRTRAA